MVVLGPRSLRREGSMYESTLRCPSPRFGLSLDQGTLPQRTTLPWENAPPPGRCPSPVLPVGWCSLGPCPAHLSWNHSLGWEKLGLVPLSLASSGQVSLKYLVVSWVLSTESCRRWSWGLDSTGPPGLSSQPSGGSTGSRAPRPSSHEPVPSS